MIELEKQAVRRVHPIGRKGHQKTQIWYSLQGSARPDEVISK
jgi:hypothetical protein